MKKIEKVQERVKEADDVDSVNCVFAITLCVAGRSQQYLAILQQIKFATKSGFQILY